MDTEDVPLRALKEYRDEQRKETKSPSSVQEYRWWEEVISIPSDDDEEMPNIPDTYEEFASMFPPGDTSEECTMSTTSEPGPNEVRTPSGATINISTAQIIAFINRFPLVEAAAQYAAEHDNEEERIIELD